MLTVTSLRIPAWLVGITAALFIAAAVRVVEAQGATVIIRLIEALALPLALFGLLFTAVDRYESREGVTVSPRHGSRRWLFLALLLISDCYLIAIPTLGGRFIAVAI